MTLYLLDTDTLIDFAKAWEPTRSRILQMIEAGDLLAVCVISVAEFYAGVPEEQRGVWDDFIGSLTFWDISRDAAMAAGRDRWRLARQGQTLTTADALIGATARVNQATILTNNERDFIVTGVPLLSLRTASP